MSFPRYPNYKDSGVEWLGKVPEHWEVRKIRWLFEIKKRIAGDLGFDVFSITQQGIRVKDLESNDGQISMDYSKYQLVEVGDFAMNHMDLLTGGVDIAATRGVTSPDYRVVTLRDSSTCRDRYFLGLFQMCYRNKIFYGFGQGSSQLGRWRMPTEQFVDFVFPLPPLAEQTAIAEFLDRETGKIDELVAEQRRLMELLKEKRQAVISHAVTRGLNPAAPLKPSGIEWLGDIPAHWTVIKLGLVSTFKGGAGFPDDYQGQADNEIPFFKVGDIVNSDESGVMRQANHTITREIAKELRAFIFASGTIVFAKVGAALLLKRFRKLGQPSCIDNNMMGMTAGKSASADFLLYVLPLLDFTLIVNPGAVPSINEGQISSQRIALPPMEEQAAIIEYLNTETAKFDTLTAEAQHAIDLLQERRTALISAAVTGQIDVRLLSNP